MEFLPALPKLGNGKVDQGRLAVARVTDAAAVARTGGTVKRQHRMINEQVEALIRGPQYAAPQAEKDALLTPILRALCREVADRCPPYRRFLDRFGGDPALGDRRPTFPRCRLRCSSISCSAPFRRKRSSASCTPPRPRASSPAGS